MCFTLEVMRISLLLTLSLLAGCSASPGPVDAGELDAGAEIVTIAAAGDISLTSIGDQKKTSDLIVDAGLDAVLLLGDNQYAAGSIADYNMYFDPTWGRMKSLYR